MAPRPKWDAKVIDSFFLDARREIGPRPAIAASGHSPGDKPSLAAAADTGWSQVVSAQALEDEVKSLEPLVAADVKSLAHFKAAGCEQARRHYFELSALFGVIGQYDGDVRWKVAGNTLQSRFAHAGHACKTPSEAAFREAQARSTELTDLVRGGSIDAGKNSTSATAGVPLVDRAALMVWLEQVHEHQLKPWIEQQRQFQAHRGEAAQQAQIVALIARLIQEVGYEYADDPGYREHAGRLETHARELLEATNQNDAASARKSYQEITHSCERCHADFRG